jgi:cobalt/nickel transport system permease protein
MHIPDGYLSPATCAVGFAIAIPTIAVASQRVQRTVKARNVPTLAVLAAVAFLVMMFNVPIPDGTTAHAVGAVLIAILLGPWAAVIAVSVALLFQALLFGDGGVLAYGVNVTNMAIIAPFVGYGVYKLISRGSTLTSGRRVIAAGVAGYVGLNAAALATAIQLGIQPTLFHAADGTPLYSPYHLAQTIPAMMLAHLVVAGFVEGALCAGTIAYLQRANIPLLQVNHPGVPVNESDVEARTPRKLSPWWIAVGAVAVMVALTPLGLLAPGGAFGEDAPEELNLGDLGLSTIPAGLSRWNGFWHSTLFPDYTVSEGANPVLGYLISAVIGIAVVGVSVFVLVWVINKVARKGGPESTDEDLRADVRDSETQSTT